MFPDVASEWFCSCGSFLWNIPHIVIVRVPHWECWERVLWGMLAYFTVPFVSTWSGTGMHTNMHGWVVLTLRLMLFLLTHMPSLTGNHCSVLYQKNAHSIRLRACNCSCTPPCPFLVFICMSAQTKLSDTFHFWGENGKYFCISITAGV